MRGLCSTHPNPDLWFPEQPQGRPSERKRKILANKVMLATAICAGCPVKAECLAEGMKPENIEHGIWGGLLAGERIRLSRTRRSGTIREQAIAFAEGVRAWESIS